jgi:hypothetical protein
MEVAQADLPGRVSSNVDLIANAAGTLAGAILSARIGLDGRIGERLLAWRERWFLPGRLIDLGMALIGLWFFGQLDPSLPLFGIVFFSDGVQAQLAGLAINAYSKIIGPLSVGLNLLALGLMLMLVMRSSRAALTAAGLLVGIAAFIKLIAATLLLRAEAAFLWVSREIAVAIALGALGVGISASFSRGWLRLSCLLTLLGVMALGLLKPGETVSFLSLRLFRWTYIQLLHYTGLAAAVAESWPFAAFLFVILLWRAERRRGQSSRQVPENA